MYVEARHAKVWAMTLAGTLSLGALEAQERLKPPALPEEPVLEEEKAPPGYEEGAAGPTPGVPTIGLAAAVALALERNFGLLSAAAGLFAARTGEAVAKARFYPKLTPRYARSSDDSTAGLDASQKLPWTGGSLSASASYRSTDTASDSLLATGRTTGLSVTLTQPLTRGFGPTATNYELTNARRNRQAQERGFELTRQRLAIDVTSAFYQVVKQRQLLEVARQSYKRSQGLRDASEARMKVGLASKLDVFRAELQASQAQESMVQSQAGLESALEQLRVLLGLTPNEPIEPEGVRMPETLASDELPPLELLLRQAQANRLDLQETRDQIEDGRRSLSIAKQNLLPQLDLNVSFTQTGFGSSFSDTFKDPIQKWNLFFSTAYPLDRSADAANKALAERDLEARQRTLRQRELDVEAEVRAAVRNLDRIRKSMELQRKGVDFAVQQQRLANLRYQRGLASNFDVVDAEGSLVASRTALVGLLTDYQVAKVQLRRATGTLDLTQEFEP